MDIDINKINAAIVVFESQVDSLKYRYRKKTVDRYRYEENAYIGNDTNTNPIIGGFLLLRRLIRTKALLILHNIYLTEKINWLQVFQLQNRNIPPFVFHYS